jgi:putative phosphoribosyl transferase
MYINREEAALKLAKKIEKEIGVKNAIILALARGGVVTGGIVSTYLGVPLDAIIVKKIGDPFNLELAIGVVGPKNTVAWNEDILKFSNYSKEQVVIKTLLNEKKKEREEQERVINKNRKKLKLLGKTIILIDDGVATGATVICAREYLRKQKVKRVVLAVPVIANDILGSIREYFDNVIFLQAPDKFMAVGEFYKDFPQVTNEEVRKILL